MLKKSCGLLLVTWMVMIAVGCGSESKKSSSNTTGSSKEPSKSSCSEKCDEQYQATCAKIDPKQYKELFDACEEKMAKCC